MAEVLLTKEELETPRTAAEILAWATSAWARFDTRELRPLARERSIPLSKELIDEALPIARFADIYYERSSDVTITHVIGYQQYDATVEDRRSNPAPISHIEVTLSDWDYDEAKRMELLNRDRTAPALGAVEAKGRRGARTVLRGKSIAHNHDETVGSGLGAVFRAVEKKTEIEYPQETALVVRIEDGMAFREDTDKEALDMMAREQLVPLLSGREFRLLALVGPLGTSLSYEIDG